MTNKQIGVMPSEELMEMLAVHNAAGTIVSHVDGGAFSVYELQNGGVIILGIDGNGVVIDT